MKFGYREICLEHDTGSRHPENPDRLRAIRRGLSKRHGVAYHAAEPANRAEIEAIHETDYLDEVEAFCADGGGNWDADTVAVEATWDAALASAGLAQWAVDASIDGAEGRDTPFAIGRPPGHHAEVDEAMGFCFFNNTAIAVQQALERSDSGVERVAVFDWDVHHGNGTQDIFYDSEDVFYASIHEQGLFPGTGEVLETGGPNARKTNLNAPVPGGNGDATYSAFVDELLDPAMERFDPDLFVVSAGFDAHHDDPISRMRVTTEGFGHLTSQVLAIADRHHAPLSFVLEGGYGLDALADSVGMVHEVFDGREPVTPDDEITDKAQRVLDDVRDAHEL